MTVSILFGAAVTHHVAGRLPQAEALYRRILELDGYNAGACNNLGMIVAADEAERLFRRAILYSPDYADAQCNLGILLFNRGAVEEARTCLSEALRIRPDLDQARDYLQRIPGDVGKTASKMAYDHVISLGVNCEVAHNIRRYTGQETPFLLDWTNTPLASVFDLIARDFSGVFQLENLEVINDGDTVLDKDNGLWFHHVFTRDANHRISQEIVVNEYKTQGRIFQYLTDRFRDVLNSEACVLFVVMMDDPSIGDFLEQSIALKDALSARYPRLNFDLLVVGRPGTFAYADQENLYFREAEPSRDGGGFGYPPGWDAVFQSIGLQQNLYAPKTS